MFCFKSFFLLFSRAVNSSIWPTHLGREKGRGKRLFFWDGVGGKGRGPWKLMEQESWDRREGRKTGSTKYFPEIWEILAYPACIQQSNNDASYLFVILWASAAKGLHYLLPWFCTWINTPIRLQIVRKSINWIAVSAGNWQPPRVIIDAKMALGLKSCRWTFCRNKLSQLKFFLDF